MRPRPRRGDIIRADEIEAISLRSHRAVSRPLRGIRTPSGTLSLDQPSSRIVTFQPKGGSDVVAYWIPRRLPGAPESAPPYYALEAKTVPVVGYQWKPPLAIERTTAVFFPDLGTYDPNVQRLGAAVPNQLRYFAAIWNPRSHVWEVLPGTPLWVSFITDSSFFNGYAQARYLTPLGGETEYTFLIHDPIDAFDTVAGKKGLAVYNSWRRGFEVVQLEC